MLEGTSGVIRGPHDDTLSEEDAPGPEHARGERTATLSASAALAGPRREIWFRRKVRLIPAMRELWDFRELVLTLAERDLRVRYKQAALGVAWAVFTPVVTMIAFTLLFTKVAHVNTYAPGVPYALFAYMGLLPWTFFSSALSGGGMSLVGNVPLLNKLYCPREVFPIAAMIDAAFDAVIASVVLLLLFPIEGFGPKIQVLYAPLFLIPLLACTLGITLAVAAVVVYMRDLRLMLPLAIQIGMFVSPVVYSPESLFKSRPLLVVYSFINPLAPVLDGARRTVLEGLAPDWLPLGVGTVSSLLMLLAGFVLFKRLETGIADVA
jgi:ABC-2 type transport system permease protein/lipopolysaccharide transport system permease protein